MTLYGDRPVMPDDRVKAEAEALMAHGLSEVHAWGVAEQNSRRDADADRFDRPEKDAKAERVESLQTAFLMANRRGQTHTLAEKFAQIQEASVVEAELERRRESHERRRDPDRMIGTMSGTTMPVPAPEPVESSESKRSRVASRARQILGPKPVKDSIDTYLSYGRSDSEPRHISYR
jgi:hypothetical protein